MAEKIPLERVRNIRTWSKFAKTFIIANFSQNLAFFAKAKNVGIITWSL